MSISLSMEKNAPVIDFPLRGEWAVLNPPGHHPLAIDLLARKENLNRYNCYFSKSLWRWLLYKVSVDDFYSWSKPIFAPCDGLVLRTSDGWPDNKTVSLISTVIIWGKATFLFRPRITGSEIDIRPNAGNYVMIQSESGVVVFLAHIRSGSLKVKIGQWVHAGQTIGEVGNSGNTTAPHLHLNLFDQVNDLLQAKVIPFIFRGYERWNGNSWKNVQNERPVKGERIRVK